MKEWIKDILIAVVIAVIIIQFIKPTIVKERSMQPTLYENNYIILSKQSYRFSEPKYKDIIVFHSDLTTEEGKEKLLIKRIIAVPGDTLEITEGKVILNDEELEEDYILDPFTSGELEMMTIPEGQIFVMGDNRQNSRDSRDPFIGCIDIDQVVGKAIFRLYPFNTIGKL